MNEEGVCRTAPATPDRLKINIQFFLGLLAISAPHIVVNFFPLRHTFYFYSFPVLSTPGAGICQRDSLYIGYGAPR